MNKKILLLVICLLGMGGVFFSLNSSVAEEEPSTKNDSKFQAIMGSRSPHKPFPMFTDVKEVRIYVKHLDRRSKEDKNNQPTPDPIKKENIENFLVDAYKIRFSSETCGWFTDVPANYVSKYGSKRECFDQPVRLMTANEYTDYLKYTDYMKDKEKAPPSVLNVIFNIILKGSQPRAHATA